MADASRIVLGLGGCVDYELKLTGDVLRELAAEHDIRTAELTSPATITSERDLVVSILSYVARGGGGERFVGSAAALASFAGRFPYRTALGGTSVRAGIAMSRLGVSSTLHLVSINDTVRRLLPPDCAYICSGVEDTCYPHLIVQYDRGLRIRTADLDIAAPSANRLIYVNDPANGAMLLTADLGERLSKAELFLISGFNAMRDEAELDRRLADLRSHMRALPRGALTYLEDAAYHEPALGHRVRDTLRDRIDLYGINEDELQSSLRHPVDLLSAREVAQALTAVADLVPVPTLVVHNKYWAAAYGERADQYANALDAGVVLATTRYRHGDDFTDQDIDHVRRQERRPEAVALAAALREQMGQRIQCVPGFALDVRNPTTVGLGDTFVGGFLAAVARDGHR